MKLIINIIKLQVFKLSENYTCAEMYIYSIICFTQCVNHYYKLVCYTHNIVFVQFIHVWEILVSATLQTMLYD